MGERDRARSRAVVVSAALALVALGCDTAPVTPPDAGGEDAGGIGDAGGGGDAGGPSPATTITSDDGLATLELPAGAVPAGVDPSSITVTQLDPASVDPVLEGAEVAVAYELAPDGLVLAAPATFRMLFEPPADTFYTVAHVSSDGTVEMPEVSTSGSEDAPGVELALEVEHFSRVAIFRQGSGPGSSWTEVDLDVRLDAHDTIVGGTVAASLTARLGSDTIVVSKSCSLDVRSVVTATGSAAFSEMFFPAWSATPNLDPSRVTETTRPDSGRAFRCISSGYFTITAYVGVIIEVQRACDGTVVGTERWDRMGPLNTQMHYCAEDIFDATDDYLDSIRSGETTFESVRDDLQAFGAERSSVEEAGARGLFNEVLECGETRDDGTITVCPEGVLDVPAGDVYVVTETVAGPLPSAGADDGHHHIYSLVVDSDGSPANDWVYVPPYDWDYFQGADRWYQLSWSPVTSSWSLTVSQVDETQAVAPSPSSVRAAIHGDTVTWFVPASELPAAVPAYRVTAFGHDGAYSPSDRGGDVSGTDPTEPLRPLPSTP